MLNNNDIIQAQTLIRRFKSHAASCGVLHGKPWEQMTYLAND